MPGATCPNCGRPVALSAAAEGPFCSARCRLIDLGAWLTDGAHSIPAEPVPVDPHAAVDDDPAPG